MFTDVSKAKTSQECMELAGLNYKLELQPMFLQGENKVDNIPVIGKKVPDKFAVVRQDNGSPLSVVGNQYQIVQNSECFGFFDGLVEQGLATFHKAYSTHNGAKVNIIADLGETNIGGDNGRKRITLRTSHDGTCRITGILQVYRLVCSNGLMAYNKENSFAIKHTVSYTEKLRQAKKLIGIADQYYKWFKQQADRLVNIPLTTVKAQELIKQIMPAVDESNVSTRLQNERESVFNRFQYGDGNQGKTAWDLYNGIGEYVDHIRSKNRDQEIAVESNLVGSGAKLKQKAFSVLTS